MKKSKVLEVVAAIFCAICLWFYVVTVVTPEDNVTITDIPVVFEGENELRNEHELIISNRSTSTVTVKFHGSRADLKQLTSNKSSISAVLDVSQFTGEREYSAGYEIELPSAMQDKDLEVLDRSPRTVQFSVERLANKQVPVKGVFDGTLAPGYVQGELDFDQDTVKVTGPSALVEQVSYAQVVVGGDNVTQTFTRPVSITLIGMEGEPLRSNDLSTDTQEIEVTLPVLLERQLTLAVKPIFGGGATEKNTTITVIPEEITVQGPQNTIADLKEFLLGELDLSKVMDGQVVEMDIALPEDVISISGETKASVTAVFNGLEILELPVETIKTDNVSDGMTAQVNGSVITVTLRGPSEDLIDMDETALSAVADLSEYNEAGSFTVPVRIETGTETIGAVGEYTVVVELRPEVNITE